MSSFARFCTIGIAIPLNSRQDLALNLSGGDCGVHSFPTKATHPKDLSRLVRVVPPLAGSLVVSHKDQGTEESVSTLSVSIVGLGEGLIELSITSPGKPSSHLEASAAQALHLLVMTQEVSLLRVGFDHLHYDLEISPMESFEALQAKTDVLPETILAKTQETDKLQDLLTLVRKEQHINLCATTDVEALDRDRGLADVHLMPLTLPELNWSELTLETVFLGKTFNAPLCITGMTGGLEKGAMINRHLAQVAQELGIPMGVGSQRIALDHPEHAAIFDVKKAAPGVFLIGNLGIAQLAAVSPERALEKAQRAVDMIKADALAIHANILQEAVQVEGDRNFSGVFKRLEVLVRSLGVPVILKEVGVGVDPLTARRLINMGIAGIDVGGKGGTSWSYIEGLRSKSPHGRQVGESFRDWGIPTGLSLKLVDMEKQHQRSTVALIATGGLRDGLHVAKCLALGANMCGIGLPLLKAALVSPEAVSDVLNSLVHGLKTAMISTGCGTAAELKQRVIFGSKFQSELEIWSRSYQRAFETKTLENTLTRDLSDQASGGKGEDHVQRRFMQ